MKQQTLTTYMHRAGIRSNRELSRLTGIPPKTMDRIVKDPRIARGYQLDSIREVCGMSFEETGMLVQERREGWNHRN